MKNEKASGKTFDIDREGVLKAYRNCGKTISEISQILGISRGTIYKVVYSDITISERMAERYANVFGCDLGEFTLEYKSHRRVEYILEEELNSTYEDIRKGIRNNIQKRLSVCHSIEFVNEILQLFDDITIESQYYGVEKCKLNETDEILEKIKKKRTHR